MKTYSLFIFLLALTFGFRVSAQTAADSSKTVEESNAIVDTIQSITNAPPIVDSIITPLKTEIESKVDTVAKPELPSPLLTVNDTIVQKKERKKLFNINKRDSTVYAKMINIGFGPSFLNLENEFPSYWKPSVGFSIGYTDAITKWLRFNANLDFVNYKVDKSKYLDAHDAKLKNELDADQKYFTSERRTSEPTKVQNEINTILDTNRAFADKYFSFRNNKLGLLQLGLSFQIRPINNYWVQPYAMFGFNVNLTTNSLVFEKANFSFSEKELTKTRKVYSDALGDSINEDYTVKVSRAEMKHDHIVYANNSIDGSLGILFGFGCDVFISPRFGIYGEFRRNVAYNAWKENFGSFQYGISTLRFGIKYRIKN
jgi:hypothetical protein